MSYLQFNRPETDEECGSNVVINAHEWGVYMQIASTDGEYTKFCGFLFSSGEAETLRDYLNRYLEK
jgi:hypothetical protein